MDLKTSLGEGFVVGTIPENRSATAVEVLFRMTASDFRIPGRAVVTHRFGLRTASR